MRTKLKGLTGLAILAAIAVMMFGIHDVYAQALTLPTRAGTTIVNGVWDGSTEADAPGELSVTISGVVTGIPGASMVAADTVEVDSGYAFSSLDSLDVSDELATSYDTVYVKYTYQNYGNLAADSFYFKAKIIDTSASGHFTPTDFDLCSDTLGVDSYVGVASKDTATWKLGLAEGAVGSLWIRLVVPSPDSAADQDSINVAISMKGRDGTGTDDGWPGLTGGSNIKRVVIDTAGVYYHTHNDTIWDYGDTQLDTFTLTVGGPTLRLRKKTVLTSATQLPGDSLDYWIYYDNDGSAATEDTAYIIDYLPKGVALLETLDINPGNATTGGIKLYALHNGIWLDHLPSGNSNLARDSILGINALKFAVAPGVAAQGGTDNASAVLADDSTGTDAGLIKFRVRIR